MPLPTGYATVSGINTRGIPRNLSKLYRQKWAAPTTAATNNILTAKAGPNTTTVVYSTTSAPLFDGSLFVANRVLFDFPRNVVITVTHASAVVALSGVITGIDLFGDAMSEAWSVTAGTTSKTFTGKKSFALVLSVSFVAVADASADTIVIGNGVVFGLDVNSQLGGTGVAVKETLDAAVVLTGVIAAKSTVSTDDPRGTFLAATAPNGARVFELVYVTDDPEFS